jgi:protein-L-isoaspartate(D-aspartate) O-methyltransferase
VERISTLYHAARDRLTRLGYRNVKAHLDDGSLGLANEAPYDAIIVTAGASALPHAYQEQLKDGGRLIIPVGPASSQTMLRITRRADQFSHEDLGAFGFVPLLSGMA